MAKTPDANTGTKTGMMRSPRSGAEVPTGAHAKNTGGKKGRSGRVPDEVRTALRGLGYRKSVPFLSDLLDGKVTVSLLGKCDACGHEQGISEELMEQWLVRVGSSVDQRLKASEQTLKYGLQSRELVIASSNASSFFDCVHTAIVEQFGATAAEMVKVRAMALMQAVA